MRQFSYPFRCALTDSEGKRTELRAKLNVSGLPLTYTAEDGAQYAIPVGGALVFTLDDRLVCGLDAEGVERLEILEMIVR